MNVFLMNNFINRDFFSHFLKQARDGTFDSDRILCDGDQVTSASHIAIFLHVCGQISVIHRTAQAFSICSRVPVF